MDIWMLGCVLYTLSYFMHPFVDSNAVGIASAVVRFPNYPEETEYRVTEKIKDFIRAMLMPNPAFRPSAEDILGFTKSWDNIDGQSLLNVNDL